MLVLNETIKKRHNWGFQMQEPERENFLRQENMETYHVS